MSELPKVTAWSWSRFADYEQCPAKFRYKHLEKRPDPGSAAMKRGNDIHKMAENFIRGRIDFPTELEGVKEELVFLKDNFARPEESWGFSSKWEWNNRNDWFGSDVWVRGKADVHLLYEDDTLLLIDWKTGRKYTINEDQIRLFGLMGFCRYPTVTEVDVRLLYTDQPEDDNEVQIIIKAAEVPALKKDWERKVKPMFVDRKFPPKPNQWCSRCPYSKANAGPCKF